MKDKIMDDFSKFSQFWEVRSSYSLILVNTIQSNQLTVDTAKYSPPVCNLISK